MLTQIINGKILTPQGWLKDGSVLISDNKILEVTNCDLAVVGATLIDAKGMYIVPGSGSRSHAAWYDQYFPHIVILDHPDDPRSSCND